MCVSIFKYRKMLLFDNILFNSFIPQMLMAFLLLQCGFSAIVTALSDTQQELPIIDSDTFAIHSQLYLAPSESIRTIHFFDDFLSNTSSSACALLHEIQDSVNYLPTLSYTIPTPIWIPIRWYQSGRLFHFSRPPPIVFLFFK